MARLWTAGGESGDLLSEGAALITGTFAFDQSHVQHAGTLRSFKFTGSGTASYARVAFTGATNTHYYTRSYVYYSAAPTGSGSNLMALGTSGFGSWFGGLTLDTDGTVHVWGSSADGFPTLVSGLSFASATWHLVEMHFFAPTAGGAAGTHEVKIDGTTVYSDSTRQLGTTGPGAFQFGLGDATTAVVWHDDLALNDSTGGAQTSWAGAGAVYLLLPTGDTALTASTWTVGDGSAPQATALWGGVNDEPPNGVADSTSTPNQIRNAAANAAGNYDATLQTYLAGGVSAADTVTLVQPVAVVGAPASTADTANVVVLSNPTVADSGANIAAFWAGVAAGTYPTGWQLYYGALSYAPSVVLGTAPVLRMGKRTATTAVALTTLMGLMVEVLPGVVTSKAVADAGAAAEGRTIGVTLTVAEARVATQSVTAAGSGTVNVVDGGVADDELAVADITGQTNQPPPAPPWPPMPGNAPRQPDTTRYTAQWTIRALNSSHQVVGAISQPRRFTLARRYNNVSDWAIELDADDPQAANVIVPGSGLSFTRTVYDLTTGKAVSSAVEVSGPMRSIHRDFVANTLQVAGKDWNAYLQETLAWPVTSYAYASTLAAMGGLWGYWRFDETAGTATDTDASGGGHTLTNVGTITQHVAGLIDDASFAKTYDGTTAYSKFTSMTGLPSGNSAFTMGAWIQKSGLTGLGTANVIMEFGTWATTRAAPHIKLNASGQAQAGTFSDDGLAGPVVTDGSPHFIVVSYTPTGTHLKLYVDGALVDDHVLAGSLAIGTAGGAVAAEWNGTTAGTFFPGTIDEPFLTSAILTDVQIAALWNLGGSRFAASAYDRFPASGTSPAETVIKHYVSVNMASSAFAERQVGGLTVAADSARGSNVSDNARFDRLLAVDGTGLLQKLATIGNVGFKLTNAAGALTFDCFVPTDRSSNIIFSAALGTVLDYGWERDAPDPEQGGNAVIVGGGQQLTSRLFSLRTDTSSVATWGRTEYFLDARDTTDLPTLQQRGDTQLATSTEVDKFSAVLAPNGQMQYGVHFFLGDKVTAIIDGIAYQDLIREVDISLDGGGAESITPVMGTPNAILVQSADLGLHKKLLRQLNLTRQIQNRT